MKHDVEGQAEGDQEQGVPQQEEEEGAKDSIKHGQVDVVSGQLGMFTGQEDEFGPRQDDGDGSHVTLE